MKKKLIRSIVRWIFLVTCGIVIGVNVYYINANQLTGNQLPMPFGYGLGTVLSGSMEPEISKGDLIIIKETGDFETGDVIVFADKGDLVVHRIIEINDNTIVTRGDANNVADSPILHTSVKGEVIYWIPYVGTVVEFLKTPLGIIITLIVAILFLEIPRKREKRRDEEKLDKIKEEIQKLKEDLL